VDTPGEYYYHSASSKIYVYPPQNFFDSGADVASAKIEIWKNRDPFIHLASASYVTVKGFTLRGVESKDAIRVTGGHHNIVGGGQGELVS